MINQNRIKIIQNNAKIFQIQTKPEQVSVTLKEKSFSTLHFLLEEQCKSGMINRLHFQKHAFKSIPETVYIRREMLLKIALRNIDNSCSLNAIFRILDASLQPSYIWFNLEFFGVLKTRRSLPLLPSNSHCQSLNDPDIHDWKVMGELQTLIYISVNFNWSHFELKTACSYFSVSLWFGGW